MCLIVLSFKQHADFPLIIAANRDEFYARPTAPLAWWVDNPAILAGRDLSAGGTWLGVNKRGQFAAVTNYREVTEDRGSAVATDGIRAADREPGNDQKGKKSRGLLVQNFLEANDTVAYSNTLWQTREDFNGYNLLFGDASAVYYFSNRSGREASALAPGLYGLSNHLLDTPWPKVTKAKAAFSAVSPSDSEAVLAFLNDNTPAPDEEVQQTGLPHATEKVLSSLFIAAPGYGTRVSSYLRMNSGGAVNLTERTFHEGRLGKDTSFTFQSAG